MISLPKVSEGAIVHVSETTKVLDVASSTTSHQTVAPVQSSTLSSSMSIPPTSLTSLSSLSSQTQSAVAAPAAQTLPVIPEQPAPEPERPASPKKKMKRKVCKCV